MKNVLAQVRSSARWFASFLVLAAIAAAASGCAAATWEQAHDKSVAYEDLRTGVNMTLVNRSHTQYQDLYSHTRPEGNIKILEDADMQLLLEKLSDLGFFDHARPAASQLPEDRIVGRVTVELDGRKLAHVMPKGLPPTPDNLERATWFRTVGAEMQEFYNTAFALQSIENDKGGELFRQEQSRLTKSPGKKP